MLGRGDCIILVVLGEAVRAGSSQAIYVAIKEWPINLGVLETLLEGQQDKKKNLRYNTKKPFALFSRISAYVPNQRKAKPMVPRHWLSLYSSHHALSIF